MCSGFLMRDVVRRRQQGDVWGQFEASNVRFLVLAQTGGVIRSESFKTKSASVQFRPRHSRGGGRMWMNVWNVSTLPHTGHNGPPDSQRDGFKTGTVHSTSSRSGSLSIKVCRISDRSASR